MNTDTDCCGEGWIQLLSILELVLVKGYSWKVDILTRCPTFYSCSKYFVYNLCENRCKVYTFHLMDSDYEEKQNYFPPTSLVLVSTLSFSPSW